MFLKGVFFVFWNGRLQRRVEVDLLSFYMSQETDARVIFGQAVNVTMFSCTVVARQVGEHRVHALMACRHVTILLLVDNS